MEKQRVSKWLAQRGLCSRREADRYIEQGWVQVDGQTVALGTQATADQHITLDPRARRRQADAPTVLLNKPVGIVSGQAEKGYIPAIRLITPDNRYPGDTARRSAPGPKARLAPAGRLDIDSQGLLVLTADGRVARALVGPQAEIEKEYLVRVHGHITPAVLARLGHGLSLDGRALKAAHITRPNTDQLRFVLREGRKRQIRRMCELVDLEIRGLKRVRIGAVRLGPLPEGQWRYLGPGETF